MHFLDRGLRSLVRLALHPDAVIQLEKIALILLAHVLEVLADHTLHDLLRVALQAAWQLLVGGLVVQAGYRITLEYLLALLVELLEASDHVANVCFTPQLQSALCQVGLGRWRQVW